MKHNLGLLDRDYETDKAGDEETKQWQRFEKYVTSLAEAGETGVKYKVLYVGRHGEGYRRSTLLPSIMTCSVLINSQTT